MNYIDSVTFSKTYKLIRPLKDPILGNLMYMRNMISNLPVLVQEIPIPESESLQHAIVPIMKDLLITSSSGKQSQSIAKIQGYGYKSFYNSHYVLLVFQYCDFSLNEQMESQYQYSSQIILKFIASMIKAIENMMQCLKSSHLCITGRHIIINKSDKPNYKLLYLGRHNAVKCIIDNPDYKIDQYFLSQNQLIEINKYETKLMLYSGLSKQNEQYIEKIDLETNTEILSDIESIGLLALKMCTLNDHRSFYRMNQQYQIEWDHNSIQQRLLKTEQIYCRKVGQVIQEMLYHHHTFEETHPDQSIIIKLIEMIHDRKNQADIFPVQSTEEKIERMKVMMLKIEEKVLTNELGQSVQNLIQKSYKEGARYIGQINQKKQREGLGVYYYPEGDVYGGTWKNNQLEGYGYYLFANGEHYEGEVKEGLKNGKGIYTYANGSIYEGEWNNDKKQGYGIHYYINKGNRYQGMHKQGFKEGQGRYTWKNGDVYQGNIHYGHKQGQGCAINSQHKIHGFWKDDQLFGQVEIQYVNGDFYRGQVENQFLHGHGIYQYNNKDYYEGIFKNNNRHTSEGKRAILKFHNGSVYEGQFKKDVMHGNGIYHHQGTTYQGMWGYGQQNDSGTITMMNGTRIMSKWAHGIPCKQATISYSNGDSYEGQINQWGRHGKGKYIFKNGKTINVIFNNGQIQTQI